MKNAQEMRALVNKKYNISEICEKIFVQIQQAANEGKYKVEIQLKTIGVYNHPGDTYFADTFLDAIASELRKYGYGCSTKSSAYEFRESWIEVRW